ncbi:hypothetical protein [Hoylesella timonensis]|uniref:hypothetical protein n=1 Tax=Hoylesella timonensis TaxID=386414 RepID=UPI00242A388A|nr:hypothetical protein [Hoylesella timonensis]
MRKVLFMLLVLAMSFNLHVFAADKANKETKTPSFEFYEVLSTPPSEELQHVETDEIESKLSAYFEDKLKACTFVRENMIPGETLQRTVTRKVNIYNAVKNIHKNLMKDVRNNQNQRKTASETLERVTRVAISAFYDENSKEFEEALYTNRKDYKKLIELFNNVVLKS